MTILVGVTDGTTVVLGADRGTSDGNFLGSTLSKKVKKVGHRFAIAYSGSGGTGQLIHSLDYPTPDENNLDMWIQRDLIPAIREATYTARIDTSNTDKSSSDLLLAVSGHLYELSTDDWSIFEYREIATGSGYQYALGSLHTSRGTPIKERVRLAAQAAIAYSPQCAKPVDIVLV